MVGRSLLDELLLDDWPCERVCVSGVEDDEEEFCAKEGSDRNKTGARRRERRSTVVFGLTALV